MKNKNKSLLISLLILFTILLGSFSTFFTKQAEAVPSLGNLGIPQGVPAAEAPLQSGSLECNGGATAIFSTANIGNCIAIAFFKVLMVPSAWLLTQAGILFDFSLNFSLNFGEFFNNTSYGLSGPSGAVYLGWSTIRNLINVFFIFILLYGALQTIIGGTSKATGVIKGVVMAALLINFSLFFAKVLVDTSNLVAIQFYSRIVAASDTYNVKIDTKDPNKGLSSAFRNAMGLETLWKNGSSESAGSFGAVTGGKLMLISIFGSAVMLIFAFVLIIGGIQFLFRSILLIMFMMTSAIAFLPGAIPGLQEQSKKWWSRFTKNLVFAPIYMATLYLMSMLIFGSMGNGIKRTGGFIDLVTSPTPASNIGIVFWYVIIISLMIFASAAARGTADSFGSGTVDTIADKMKKLPWRTTKAVGVGLRDNRATDKVVNAALSSGLGKALRSVAPGTFGKLADRNLERAKARSSTLWRHIGEDQASYEKRQNKLVSDAHIAQLNAIGLRRGEDKDDSGKDYYIDENNNVKMLLDKKALKDRVKELQANKMGRLYGRKEAKDYIDKVTKTLKPSGKSSVEDKEDELEKLRKDLTNHPATYDDASEESEIAKITQQEADFRKAQAKAIAKQDVAAMNYLRTLQNDVKNIQKDKAKAIADHKAKKDRMETEIRKLERLVKEQKEREDSSNK